MDFKRRNRSKPWQPDGATDDKPPPDPCPRCKKLGFPNEWHWMRKCPRINTEVKPNVEDDSAGNRPVALLPVKSIDELGFVHIDVRVNSKKFRPLLDTGSKITCMSSSAARSAGLNPKPSTAITIRQVDGITRTQGVVTPRLSIGKLTQKFPIHVLPNLGHDMLLGIDAGIAFKLKIDLTSASVDSNRHKAVVTLPDSLPVAVPADNDSIAAFLDNFDVFSTVKTSIGRLRDVQHVIRLKPDAIPVYRRPYRLSAEREQKLRVIVDDLLAKGLIRRSRSPWGLPMFVVPKKAEELRPVIDYGPLNAVTIPEHEPLPIIRHLIDRLSNATVFSVLDIQWAFWNVSLHPDSIECTSFVTTFGQLEWLVLPMGVRNGVSVFQRELRRVLGDLEGNGVELYCDDLIVYSKTESKYRELLSRLFNCLTREGLRLKRDKCKFFQSEVEFLGFVISANSVRPSPTKVKAILGYPTPTNVKAIQRFVGIGNYFRHLVLNYSSIVEPLIYLTRKDVEWRWEVPQQNAFETLKKCFAEEPIYDPSRPLVLQTDASGVGLGAVLWQRRNDDELRPIAYWSCSLNVHEKNYSAPKLECLAVIKAIEHFRVYLEDKHFDVWTDCSALAWLFKSDHNSSIIHQWRFRLEPYDFTVSYRPGAQNQVADAFSRAPVNFVQPDLIAQYQDELESYDIRKPVTVDGLIGVRYRGVSRLAVPPSVVPYVLKSLHDAQNHPGTRKTIELVASRYWWPHRDDVIRKYVKTCRTCQLVKPPNEATHGHLHPVPTPEVPNVVWALDTIVIGTAAKGSDKKYVITAVDHHSRYRWAVAVKNNTSQAVITFLTRLFESFGKPTTILADNGTNYVSKQLRKFLTERGVHIVFSPPYRPEANGLCEKTNDTLITGIRLALTDNPRLRWTSALDHVLKTINDRPHDVTGSCPRYLHFGTTAEGQPPPTQRLEDARRLATERSHNAQVKRAEEHALRHEHLAYSVGDFVKYRLAPNHPTKNKFSPYFVGPCRVVEWVGHETYVLDELDPISEEPTRRVTQHASKIAKYYVRKDENVSEIHTNNLRAVCESRNERIISIAHIDLVSGIDRDSISISHADTGSAPLTILISTFDSMKWSKSRSKSEFWSTFYRLVNNRHLNRHLVRLVSTYLLNEPLLDSAIALSKIAFVYALSFASDRQIDRQINVKYAEMSDNSAAVAAPTTDEDNIWPAIEYSKRFPDFSSRQSQQYDDICSQPIA